MLARQRPKECTGSAPTAITIQQELSGPDGPAVSFTYEVFRDGSLVATRTLSVAPGGSASTTVGGLGPGAYRVDQYPDPASPVAPAINARAAKASPVGCTCGRSMAPSTVLLP